MIGKVGDTNYFQKIFPLVELVKRGEGYRPAEYIGKGQYQDVTKFDSYNGVGYFRELAAERISRVEKDGVVGCATVLQIERFLRFVACIPKSQLNKDDAFTDDRIANRITKALSFQGGLIQGQLKASSVTVTPSNVETNNKTVLEQEYPGLDIKDINYSYAYLAVDFSVVIEIKADCIDITCEDY